MTIKKIIRFVINRLPGSELRRCKKNSRIGTKCIKHLNHWFKHEDAWRHKWK